MKTIAVALILCAALPAWPAPAKAADCSAFPAGSLSRLECENMLVRQAAAAKEAKRQSPETLWVGSPVLEFCGVSNPKYLTPGCAARFQKWAEGRSREFAIRDARDAKERSFREASAGAFERPITGFERPVPRAPITGGFRPDR